MIEVGVCGSRQGVFSSVCSGTKGMQTAVVGRVVAVSMLLYKPEEPVRSVEKYDIKCKLSKLQRKSTNM